MEISSRFERKLEDHYEKPWTFKSSAALNELKKNSKSFSIRGSQRVRPFMRFASDLTNSDLDFRPLDIWVDDGTSGSLDEAVRALRFALAASNIYDLFVSPSRKSTMEAASRKEGNSEGPHNLSKENQNTRTKSDSLKILQTEPVTPPSTPNNSTERKPVGSVNLLITNTMSEEGAKLRGRGDNCLRKSPSGQGNGEGDTRGPEISAYTLGRRRGLSSLVAKNDLVAEDKRPDSQESAHVFRKTSTKSGDKSRLQKEIDHDESKDRTDEQNYKPTLLRLLKRRSQNSPNLTTNGRAAQRGSMDRKAEVSPNEGAKKVLHSLKKLLYGRKDRTDKKYEASNPPGTHSVSGGCVRKSFRRKSTNSK